jgi:hypothetical protein
MLERLLLFSQATRCNEVSKKMPHDCGGIL